MSREQYPLTVYLSADEKQKLEEWADKTGKSQSELGRQAILEYTDRDRVERIEHEVGEIHDKLDTLLSQAGTAHTHKGGQRSVPETAREIARLVYRNFEMPVKDTDVELTIEDNAGADDRTVEKYKGQLKKRGLLYQHPTSPVWTDDKEQWVMWVENAHHNPDVHEVTQEYSISTTEYTKLAETVKQ